MSIINDTLIVIPARGGSKGLPQKNIKKLNGKPLILYTVEAARKIAKDENVCVSSDDKSIIEIVEQSGLSVPFVRPLELASDTATTEGVLLHAIAHYKSQQREFKKVILLQPTSPFRTSKHIQEAYQLFGEGVDMVVSAFPTKANPYYVLFEERDGLLQKSKMAHFTRRQDCPVVWELNGALYIYDTKILVDKGMAGLTRKKLYPMDKYSSVDIDDDIDFMLAEMLVQKGLVLK